MAAVALRERVMIDVFVKVWAESPMRAAMASAVLERLALMDDARVFALSPAHRGLAVMSPARVGWISLGPEQFWISAKAFADAHASSPIYVVLDDDHLPIGKTWLADGVAAMEQNPEYAMLSSWSINAEVDLGSPWLTPELTRSIGTPYFCRRQSLGVVPDGPLESYDQALTDHVRKIGRVGFLRHVRHNHLGYGYSQVVPGHWGA